MFLIRQRPARVVTICKATGFTLVEIALALGIFAFAIVAIMALFPVGLRSANESRVETIVAQIARTVLSDLRTPPLFRLVNNPAPAPPTNAPILNSNGKQMGTFQAALVAIGDPSLTTPEMAFQTIDLTQTSTTYLIYTSEGKIKALSDAAKYAIGDTSGDLIVKIDSKLSITTTPQLAQVTVTVEAPAAAPVASRTKYPVVTLMGDNR